MNMKNVIVFETDDLEDIPERPDEFINFWKEKIDLIPIEFKNAAEITLEPDVRWDCGYLEFKIIYKRPETEEEASARMNSNEMQEENKKKREIAALIRLKAKYPDV